MDFTNLDAKELWIRMFTVDAEISENDCDGIDDEAQTIELARLCDEIERRYGKEALDNTGEQCYRSSLEDCIRWVNENFENLEATARGEI